MILLICILLPAVLATKIYGFLSNDIDLKIWKIILNYFVYLLLITYVNLIILTFIYNNGSFYININSFTNLFAVKYISLSLILAIVLPFILKTLEKNIEIKVNFEKRNNSNNEK